MPATAFRHLKVSALQYNQTCMKPDIDRNAGRLVREFTVTVPSSVGGVVPGTQFKNDQEAVVRPLK